MTTAGTFFLAMWHGVRVGRFRKQADIGYPKVVADSGDLSSAEPDKKKAMYLFNCAQRAHQNYLENQPSVIAALLIAGVEYPLTTAGLGVAWMVNRVIYAVGYTREDKTGGKGRLAGSAFWLCQLGLFGLTGWVGLKKVM